jgi:hypothetical protein
MASSSLVKGMRGMIMVCIGKSSMIKTGKPIAAGRKNLGINIDGQTYI